MIHLLSSCTCLLNVFKVFNKVVFCVYKFKYGFLAFSLTGRYCCCNIGRSCIRPKLLLLLSQVCMRCGSCKTCINTVGSFMQSLSTRISDTLHIKKSSFDRAYLPFWASVAVARFFADTSGHITICQVRKYTIGHIGRWLLLYIIHMLIIFWCCYLDRILCSSSGYNDTAITAACTKVIIVVVELVYFGKCIDQSALVVDIMKEALCTKSAS